MSGLQINKKKSSLMGVGVSLDLVRAMGRKLNCLTSEPVFNYLGFLVGKSMNYISSWNEVMKKVRNRLSVLKSRVLSIGWHGTKC